MKLYHSQYTRSARVRWMLEELGAPHEIVRLSLAKGEHKTPEHLALHPHGAVPVLVDGDLRLIESSAILLHLADKFADKKLAPPLGSDDRAHYYRWLVYVPANVDPALEAVTFHTRLLPPDKRVASIAEDGKRKWDRMAPLLSAELEGRTYVVGDSFTAADIVVASVLGWVNFLGTLDEHPKLAAYFKGMQGRPAYQRAHAD